VLTWSIEGKSYAIGWADSNNMENSVRDRVIARTGAEGITMLEVCTSDTHSTSGKRTREGYFALGSTENPEHIADAYLQMCRSAKDVGKCRFDLSFATSDVKVMGVQFGDYSAALDKAMSITKVFVGVTFAAFIVMQVLAR
jgi:putative membrane protein